MRTYRASVWPQFNAGLRMMVVMTAALGLGYPLLMTGVAQALFPGRADGSIVTVDGVAVGSRLIGQEFTAPQYFHGRPSAVGYDSSASSGSNLGPTNPDHLAAVAAAVADYRTENGLPARTPVPVDAVTASGSGLDPHISVANAKLQAARVAQVRGVAEDVVLALVEQHVDHRDLGIFGDDGVNVLTLNIALDQLEP